MSTRTGVLLVLFALAVQGCVDVTVQGYGDLTYPLDGTSELHVSTYPAWYASEESSIPFLYKSLRTPDSVYFQVFVREAGTEAGPNPHIDSITIHSFSYQFPGQAPVELVADFQGNFWAQGDPEDNPDGVGPVQVSTNWYLQLNIDLTLNGQRHQVDERVQAFEREYRRPLILHSMR